MKVIILPSAEEVAALAAAILANRVKQRPDLVLGLATGRTMEAVYAELSALHRTNRIDFSRITTFNLDEYVGLSGEDVRSYQSYMRTKLFDPLGLAMQQTHIPKGDAQDPSFEAEAYEQSIASVDGIDLQLLGIGENGHIGFNEPLSGFNTRSRVVTLAEATLEQNAPMFDSDIDRVPKRAITMGIATILAARSLLLVATGEAKADAVARAIEGPLSAAVPGSAIQLHAHCLVILDEAAAQNLTLRMQIAHQIAHDEELIALLAGGKKQVRSLYLPNCKPRGPSTIARELGLCRNAQDGAVFGAIEN